MSSCLRVKTCLTVRQPYSAADTTAHGKAVTSEIRETRGMRLGLSPKRISETRRPSRMPASPLGRSPDCAWAFKLYCRVLLFGNDQKCQQELEQYPRLVPNCHLPHRALFPPFSPFLRFGRQLNSTELCTSPVSRLLRSLMLAPGPRWTLPISSANNNRDSSYCTMQPDMSSKNFRTEGV